MGLIVLVSCGSVPAESQSSVGTVDDRGTTIETTTLLVGESASSFCAAADRLFNHSSFASDGGGVIDLAALADAEQKAMTVAIGEVEAKIAEFQNGGAPGGWSTEAAANEAARICGQDM